MNFILKIFSLFLTVREKTMPFSCCPCWTEICHHEGIVSCDANDCWLAHTPLCWASYSSLILPNPIKVNSTLGISVAHRLIYEPLLFFHNIYNPHICLTYVLASLYNHTPQCRFSKYLHCNSSAIIFIVTQNWHKNWLFLDLHPYAFFKILVSHYNGIIAGSLQTFTEVIMR